MTRRLAALVLAAVVAPAAVVAVLGYLSLRQWAQSAELLYREQARDVAAMTAEKVELTLRRAEDGFLEQLQLVLTADGVRPPALDALVSRSPLVRRLWLFDVRGTVLYPRAFASEEDARLARLVGERARAPRERVGKRELVVGDELLCIAVVLETREGAPVVAVLARDVDALRREVLQGALGGLESPTVLAVLDHAGRPVYSRASLDGAERVLTVPFRSGLPNWSIAVYQPPGTAPRAALRRQLMMFSAAYAVLVLIIAAGAVATWRLMRRESEMAQLKADFVANVSHDLKTPLSVIRMFGETLALGRVPDEPARREYYRVITRESERLSRLIDNVLDFSRIERGRRRYDLAPTAVEPLVRDTLDAFAYPLAQQGFKVDVSVAPDLPDVPMDAEAVGQALANLIDNALKYSGEERWIGVDARVEDGWLALGVTDRGIGIPRAEHARIFEKFYRVGPSDTQARRGSGVGLALVRHVAEAHGGAVTLESAPGEGSRFTLRLPLGTG